jgi:hypothetical protein
MEQLGEMAEAGSIVGRLAALSGLVDGAVRGGRETDAAACANRALRLQPENALLHRLTGHMRVRAGDLEGGLEGYRRAARLMSRDPRNALALASPQIQLGEIDEASKILDTLPTPRIVEIEDARILGERDLLRAVVAEIGGRSAKARRLLGSAVRTFSPLGERRDVAEVVQRLGVGEESFGRHVSTALGGGSVPAGWHRREPEGIVPGLAGGSMGGGAGVRSSPTSSAWQAVEHGRPDDQEGPAVGASWDGHMDRDALPRRLSLGRSERRPDDPRVQDIRQQPPPPGRGRLDGEGGASVRKNGGNERR